MLHKSSAPLFPFALAALLTETRRDAEAIVELEAVLRLCPHIQYV